MSTIANRLRNLYDNMVLANSVTNEFVQALPDCYEAVEEKGGTVPAEPTAANLPNAIKSIPAATPVIPEKDVIFIDYDGTILASYTYAELENVTEMPTPPTHEGLTFEGWTNTLSELKTYKKKITVSGAMYKPTDDKTHIFIRTYKANMTFAFSIASVPSSIDWGDGIVETPASSPVSHQYQSAGDYEIKISGENFQQHRIGFSGYDSVPLVTSIWISGLLSNQNVTIGQLSCLSNLKSIVIPSNIPGFYVYGCSNLKAIVTNYDLANTITESAVLYITHYHQRNGQYVYSNPSLRRINFPATLTPIQNFATNRFHYQRCLEYIWFNLDAGVHGVQQCVSCKEIHMPWTTPPALSNTNLFTGLPTTCTIYVKTGTASAYETATNWSTIYARYTFVEED